jgi:GNAT superfamily N-acetyltransferase
MFKRGSLTPPAVSRRFDGGGAIRVIPSEHDRWRIDNCSMLLRTAQPADAAAVAAIHVRSWQAGYRGLLPDEYLDALRPEDRAGHYTFDDPDPLQPATSVALEGGAICGFATTGPSRVDDRGETGELLALYVDPDRWGLGIGRALLQEARARLARAGFEQATLWVLVGNRRAERFYRIDGWAPDGSRRQNEAWGLTVDEIGYRRSLT